MEKLFNGVAGNREIFGVDNVRTRNVNAPV